MKGASVSIAFVLAVAVVPVLLLLRRSGTPAPRRWARLSLGWLAAAAVAGPFLASGGGALLHLLTSWPAVVADPAARLGEVVPAAIFVGVMYLLFTVLLLVPPYLPILLLWARLGTLLGWLERTRSGVVLSSVVLALPAAIGAAVAHAAPAAFPGAADFDSLRFGGFILLATSAGLAVPRLVCCALRPGIFVSGAGSSAASAG